MKKGWQKRLWKSGFKPDWNIEYGEFVFQYIVWFLIIIGLCAFVGNIIFDFGFRLSDFIVIFIGGLIGGSIAYYIKHKKKN